MAFARVKATLKEFKTILRLSQKAKKQVTVLTQSLEANQADLAELKRAAKRTQYENQVHLDRIKDVQEKMKTTQSNHSKL
ncbi:hypothetical protein [Fructobacillus americanaquae]|uniref:Uncharacterized protein n=1 Tax=Fructobacillus americanaquae TaxID=2940302 RepID=A0ABY5BZN8_9LACO|nr:hypothetical protein [Fructobacillus americanaquae]USS91984.1 hypothetical protein M3M36_06650 [Fructobacillus americanaquae]